MPRVFPFLSILLFSFSSFAQMLTPVKWTWKAEEISKGNYKLTFTAKIDKNWHTYSQFIQEGGPVKTAFVFEKNASIELSGKTSEKGGKVHNEFDPVFEMQLKYFEDLMVCEQNVKVLRDTKLKGTIEFMACDDKQCLPPDLIDFEFDLKGSGSAPLKTDTVKSQGSIPSPFDSIVAAEIDKSIKNDSGASSLGACNFGEKGFDANRFGTAYKDCGKQVETATLWDAILQGLIWGFIAVFMPCVFPMIPLTVSFFTKRSETSTKGKRDALIYAGSIVFIFFLFSLPFVLLGASQDSLNEFATNPVLNIIFFLIFVVFAFSFFGFYDISLPSSWVNKSDSASGNAGIAGIFFMALTLVLVSFSCTGPLLANLIGNSLSGDGGKLNLMVGFSCFGIAMALPFALFSLFPAWLKKLPKSGGWMGTFKVVLGFIELILAFKFFANADNVSHWGIMQREVFLAIWAALGFALFMYLIGVFRFAKEEANTKISFGRYGLALFALLFSFYSAYGVYCNELKLFSGFPPPKLKGLSWCVDCKNDCPLGLNCYHDYCQALEAAKRENKPIMIDFTGLACVNCRRMEENVWSKPEVFKMISENYILLSLYVDDRKPLPEGEQYFSTHLNKKVKTYGNKWSDFENTCFNKPSQPYYVLISPTERLLNDPRGYTPGWNEYLQWLQCGLQAHKEMIAE